MPKRDAGFWYQLLNLVKQLDFLLAYSSKHSYGLHISAVDM